jgi:hypothetical protein
MYCRGRAHSCNNRVLHLHRSTGPEFPSLAMGAPPAARRSEARRPRQALLLPAALMTAEKRRRVNFWICDESWIIGINQPTGSWLRVDKDLSQRVHQTTTAVKSMQTVFLNMKEFVIMNLSLWGTSFTARYFVYNVSIPLASRHTQQRGDRARHQLRLLFAILNPRVLSRSKTRRPVVGASVFPNPFFTRFGHRRLFLVRVVQRTSPWENHRQ